MKPIEAVRTAKSYLQEILADEAVVNIGLEELEFEDEANVWRVTLGFSRPWDEEEPRRPAPLWADDRSSPATVLKRNYRVIRVRDADGGVEGVTIRQFAA